MDLKIFSGKKVFITGHTGFKGTWLSLLLTELGADVRGFALQPNTVPSHFKLLKLDERIESVIGDIRDYKSLNQSLSEFKPEIVFHLAAQPLVKESYLNPRETFEINIQGSTNLLESVKNCNSVQSLVFITSDKCYENVEWAWGYRENDVLGGRDPYSASKGAAELVFSSYLRSFFNDMPNFGAASARAGNVIGGGDWSSDRIIPDCIRSIESNTPLVLRNPSSTRPWQHVLEPLSGYLDLGLALLEDPHKYSGSWNFGPSAAQVRTVEQVASLLFSHLNSGTLETSNNHKEFHEANLLQLNCDKAQQILGWKPRWNVEKTLQATADWYDVALKEGDIELISRIQLKEYFEELK